MFEICDAWCVKRKDVLRIAYFVLRIAYCVNLAEYAIRSTKYLSFQGCYVVQVGGLAQAVQFNQDGEADSDLNGGDGHHH